ncbi:MAG: hypothetical protein JWR80_494 [Bradyrhizobium sp.]|nr:hypothetical protein [Bradyrhizobium sp.]
MLVARETLNLTKDLINEFATNTGSGTGVPITIVQAQYISIVCMLRAVGHVLMDDCEGSPKRSAALSKGWKTWGKSPIFAKFIKPTRDNLLKEFKDRLRLDVQGDAGFAVMSGANGPTVVTWADASKVVDAQGRPVLAAFREGVQFWEAILGEIEAVQE